MRKNIFRFIIALTMVFASQAWGSDQVKGSGFIDAPPILESVPGMKGTWGWDKSGFKPKAYNKFFLDPVEIWLAPDSKYKGIDANEMKILADSMREILVEALEPDYPVVSKAGPGVLRIRIAITNVHLKKKRLRVLDFTPVGLTVNAVKKLAGKQKRILLMDASVEAEMLDSLSAERLSVRIDNKPLKSLGKDSKKMSWELIGEALSVYGKKFRERIEQGRGK